MPNGLKRFNAYNPTLIEDVKKIVNKIKTCESRVGLHICKKHPEDCYFVVDVEELLQKLKSLKNGKNT